MPLQVLAAPIRKCLYVLCLSSASILPAFASDTEGFWREIRPASSIAAQQQPTQGSAIPSRYRQFDLDLPGLHRHLSAAMKTPNPSPEVDLPLPNGGFSRFKLVESGVLPAKLAEKFPDILSFKGSDIDGRLLSLDLTGNSLRAAISTGQDEWLVQRAWDTQSKTLPKAIATSRYWSFSQSDIPAQTSPIDPEDKTSPATAQNKAHRMEPTGTPRGNILYNFRVAITATSGFTRAFGGSVEDGLLGVVSTVNRMNRTFEVDMGVHFTLIDENEKLILTNPDDDPTQENTDWHEENRKLLESVVGAAAYDTGFMLNTFAGGTAGGVGNTCIMEVESGNLKKHTAYGFAGHEDPVNAPKFMETTVHEFGHKIGAAHNADGDQIMNYAPIRHFYFHALSMAEMNAWLSSLGGRCATKQLNPNAAPWIDPDSLPQIYQYIPANTPFNLSAVARYAVPGAKLTFTWDQTNGYAFPEPVDPGYGNLSTSLPPSPSAERTFPSLPVILNEKSPQPGDQYPAKSRDLNYILTVRDNQMEHPTTAQANAAVRVHDTGTAFAVTEPDKSVHWKAGGIYDIAWNVAQTHVAPVSCPRVAVHLSTDGGYHYLVQPLATNRPNNGRTTVGLPQVNTLKARLRVSCENNIFFAVTPTDIVITP
jgi:hypothetical protein